MLTGAGAAQPRRESRGDIKAWTGRRAVFWSVTAGILAASSMIATAGTHVTAPPRILMAAAADKVHSVSHHSVAKGHRSGIGSFTAIVVRSAPEWTALWKKHTSSEPNPPPPPTIDFANETVAGVFLGEQPTGGYEVEIVRIEKDAAAITLSFIEKQPPPGGIVTQALTQPFHIVRFSAQGSGTIAFRRLP
jgi:hypothetical protein